MLINVEEMRMLKVNDTEVRFKLIRQNIERFFRDYIYYFNIYERNELIIDAGYLPYHYLDSQVLHRLINLLEDELGYGIIIMKITNVNKKGYIKDDLINIRLFDKQNMVAKDADDYFNLKMFHPLYSTFHDYNNIDGSYVSEKSYLSCIGLEQNVLLN